MDAYLPTRVTSRSLAQVVVASLRRAIVLGELAPGLHLEEPALADKFAVSRVPIREALTRLSHEGLVRIEPRRGAFVIGVDEDDVHDIYGFRLLLERHALPLAADRVGPAQVVTMQQAIDAMRQAVTAGQQHLIAGPDMAFHQAIITAAGSKRLLAAWHQIVGLVETLLGIADTFYVDMPTAIESHQTLFAALTNRDLVLADSLICNHLEHAAEILVSAMRAARVVALAGAR